MGYPRSIAAPWHPSEEPPLVVKRLDAPESVLAFDRGRLDLITIGGRLVGKGSYAPGWRWSNSTAPPRPGRAPARMAGMVLAGRARLQLPGAPAVDLTPGDIFQAVAEYDSWVVGYRACEVLYFDGIELLLDRLHGEGPRRP
jgi:hypothetical protein